MAKNEQKIPVIVIVGPTASGKTGLAVALAKKMNGEVISADSRQVYRGLDIGTVKVTKKEMRGVPHHLLDVAAPRRAARAATAFSAADFVRLADRAIADIARRGRLPIVAGGTGYYVDALLRRIHVPDAPPNPALRRSLEKKTPAQLFLELKKLDPARARSIEPTHPRRLIRAIEIATALGKSPTKLPPSPYTATVIGIAPAPAALEKRIKARAGRFKERRYWSALKKETEALREAGLTWKRIDTLGFEYALMGAFLRGSLSKKDLPARLTAQNVHYAKRQMRYLRRNPEITWVSTPTLTNIFSMLK